MISNADPRRTLLELVDPVELDPGFLTKIRNYRMPGTVAKLDLALRALARVPRLSRNRPTCAAAFTSARRSTISSGPSTRRSTARSRASRTSTSRFRRCSIRRWRRQAARDVGLHAVRAVQARERARLDLDARHAGHHRAADARALRARHQPLWSKGSAGPDAGRSRDHVRPDRRPHPPRRAVARSAVHDAAGARLGAVPDADRRAVPVRRRHTSGRRPDGGSGQNAAREIIPALKKRRAASA